MFLKKILNNKLILPVLFLAILFISGGFYYFYSQTLKQDSPKVLQLVKNLPEVQEWLNLFSNPDGTSLSTGGRPIIEIDSFDKGVYTIHAYESLTDHRATFNWFYADMKTGSIKDFFGKEYLKITISPSAGY